MKRPDIGPVKLRVFVLRWMVPAAIYLVLQLFVFDSNGYLLAGWAGFCVGGNLMYVLGQRDREKILAHVYGKGWKDGLATYSAKEWMKERRQKAPLN